MGFKLGRSLKKLTKSVFKSLPGAIGGFITGGPTGALLGAFSRKMPGLSPASDVGAGIPSIQQLTGAAPFLPSPVSQPFINGGLAVPVAGSLPAVAMGMSRAVVSAIVKLATSLGVAVTAANVGRVGMRLWRSVSAMARRHPGVSILTFLTGLGLVADEAAEFLFWGQAKRRRRRGGGISGRDLRVTRRTLRRLSVFRSRVGLSGGGVRRRSSRRRGDGAIVVAQQD